MRIPKFEFEYYDTLKELRAIAESDIRGAYGETTKRILPNGRSLELYDEVVRREDEVLKAHQAEVDDDMREYIRKHVPERPLEQEN